MNPLICRTEMRKPLDEVVLRNESGNVVEMFFFKKKSRELYVESLEITINGGPLVVGKFVYW